VNTKPALAILLQDLGMGGILFDLSTRLPENGLFLNAHHAALRDVPSMIMIIEGKSHSDTRELIAQKNICSMTCAQLQ